MGRADALGGEIGSSHSVTPATMYTGKAQIALNNF